MKPLLSLTLTGLVACASFAAGQVTFAEQPGRVQVSIQGKPFGALYCAREQDKPFFFPLRSAAGVNVVRGWPVEPAPGDSDDHPHQRGLWWAHGLTNGVDFWTNREGTGRYELKSAPKVNAASATIRVDLDMVSPKKEVLGSLIQEYTFRADGDHRMVDIYIQVLADRMIPIKLGDTREGVMGIRVCEELKESRGATLLNSEGGAGEKQIWGKRARWVDYSGKVQGTAVGVAMFDHPSNPKSPTFWMARGYGLLAANAFGESEFTGDKTRDGSLTIPAGGKLEFRHRVLIHPGDAKTAGVEKLYQRWAAR
jgi:Methane oxygenase PmoA